MKRFLILGLSLLMALGLVTMASAAPMVFFDFDGDKAADTSLVVYLNDTFTANVLVSIDDLSSLGGLVSAGVTVDFDVTQLAALSATAAVGSPFPTPDAPWSFKSADDFDNTAGTADIGAGTIAGFNGPIVLPIGTVEFRCIAAGVSTLLTLKLFPDEPGFDAFVTGDGTVLDFNTDPDLRVVFGSAEIGVPIPGTVLLFGSGLVGLLAIRRRRQV